MYIVEPPDISPRLNIPGPGYLPPAMVFSMCVYVSRSVMSDSATPWTVACQVSLSMEFTRQEYRRGLPFPSPEWSGSCIIPIEGLQELQSNEGKGQ